MAQVTKNFPASNGISKLNDNNVYKSQLPTLQATNEVIDFTAICMFAFRWEILLQIENFIIIYL